MLPPIPEAGQGLRRPVELNSFNLGTVDHHVVPAPGDPVNAGALGRSGSQVLAVHDDQGVRAGTADEINPVAQNAAAQLNCAVGNVHRQPVVTRAAKKLDLSQSG